MPRGNCGHNRGAMASGLSIIQNDVRRVAESLGGLSDRLAGRTLLLTGASGFLASAMADTIVWLNDNALSQPCFLLCLVRSPVETGGRLAHLIGREDVRFVEQDVSDPIRLDRRPDFIVHAASNASPRKYLRRPIDTMDANVVGTRRLLELARIERVESVLFFSSGEIYGEVEPDGIPTPETCPGRVDCTAPRACYVESKRFAETLCVTYWREHHVPVKIVRPFHVYGPGMHPDDGRVIPEFLRCRLEGAPINLLSDGGGSRAFCYVSDATAGFWRALLSDHNGEAFNIGNDAEEISIRDLAQLIAEMEQPELSVSTAPPALPEHLRGSPLRVCPDIGKAERLLGYRPRLGLRDGLRNLLAYWRGAGF